MRHCLLIVTLTFLPLPAGADEWQPPENPDPQVILKEAGADRRAGRYAVALAKHVWFHDHALDYEPAMTGVRLSFALSDWHALGKDFPPALAMLEAARDTAAENVLVGKDVRASFRDLTAIGRTLGDDSVTKSIFEGLDVADPDTAKQVYRLAQPTLVRAKAYKLCAKYIDPQRDFARIQLQYRQMNRLAENRDVGAQILEHSKKRFINDVATLVALLVVNEREDEAEQIAKTAKQEWDDVAFHAAIDKALAGTVPRPWP